MKVLFDQGTPVPLRAFLGNHEVITAFERGWHTLQNGELLSAAESDGFDVIVITDKNLRYQQNLSGRHLAVVVLSTTDWRLIRQHTAYVSQSLDAVAQSAYVELPFPP